VSATHTCPAPKCRVTVPNSMLACRPHWYGLPRNLRDAVWATADQSLFEPARADVLAQVVDYYRSKGW